MLHTKKVTQRRTKGDAIRAAELVGLKIRFCAAATAWAFFCYCVASAVPKHRSAAEEKRSEKEESFVTRTKKMRQ